MASSFDEWWEASHVRSWDSDRSFARAAWDAALEAAAETARDRCGACRGTRHDGEDECQYCGEQWRAIRALKEADDGE